MPAAAALPAFRLRGLRLHHNFPVSGCTSAKGDDPGEEWLLHFREAEAGVNSVVR
jgi:hypothetical protein